jgi:type VI secretion system protein ImpF
MHALSSVAVLPRRERRGAAPGARCGVRLTPAEALQLSLRLDLVRLFNARNGLTIAQFLGGGPTALGYGLPDTRALSPSSSADLECWERVITRAILLYEPRLRQVQVRVTQDAARPAAARVRIAATAAGADQAGAFDAGFDATFDDVLPHAGA